MIKKILSIGLSLAIAISVCNLPASAWVPTDFDDPKCIDIRKLGNGNKYIAKPEKVCRCKKCSIDAFTYSYLEQYVRDQRDYIENLDNDIKIFTQNSIDYEAKKHGGFNLVFISSNLYGPLKKFIGSKAPIAVAVIMMGSTIYGLYCWYRQHEAEIIAFENKIKQQNILSALKNLANEIEDKSYKDGNFILVSKNSSPRDQGSVAQFARKDGLTYNEEKYNDEYFNNINDNMIKPLIKKIEDKAFQSYEAEEYETTLRDILKNAYSVTIPASVFTELYRIYKEHKSIEEDSLSEFVDENIQKVDGFMKKYNISKEQLILLLKYIDSITKDSPSTLKKIINMGTKSLTILLEDTKNSDPQNPDNAKDESNEFFKNNNIIPMPKVTIDDAASKAAPAA